MFEFIYVAQSLLISNDMKKKLPILNCFIIAGLIPVILMACALPALAWEGPSDIEVLLVEAINQGRANVLGEQDNVVLVMDERLFESAGDHLEEIRTTEIQTIYSEDGSGPETRMLNRGYAASECGEAIGMVLFQRYLSKEDAVAALYNAMIQEDGENVSCLMNSALKEIGVSVQTGVTYSIGRKFNYYMAVADVAVEAVSSEEKCVLLEVNNVRQIMALPALASNAALFLKAQQDLAVILAEYVGGAPAFDSSIDMENVRVLSKVWITTDPKSEAEAIPELIKKLFYKESFLAEDSLVLTNQGAGCAGVAIAVSVPLEYSQGVTYYINAIVFEAALNLKQEEDTYEISGILYADDNMCNEQKLMKNTQFAEVGIYAYGDNGSALFFTGDLGEFFVNLPAGEYTMEYLGGVKIVCIDDANKFIFLPVTGTGNDF